MAAIALSSSGDAPALAFTLMPEKTDIRYRAVFFGSNEERISFLFFAARISFSRAGCKDDAAATLIEKTTASENPNSQIDDTPRHESARSFELSALIEVNMPSSALRGDPDFLKISKNPSTRSELYFRKASK